LKPYGDEFAGHGFVIPEEEKDRYYVTGGDDLLWLNKDFPLAARFDAYAVYQRDAVDDEGEEVEFDLQTPWGLKLLSGGALARGVGYYFYFYVAERGEVAGIEDAIIHFDKVFGSELDVAVGQFQTSDPLLKRELRLTYEDYLLYTIKVGESRTNLTYDRGLMLSYGIAKTGTDLVGLVVNGNGKGEAGEDRIFDQDRYKNVGLRLSQSIGDHLSVGGFFYYGKEGKTVTDTIAPGSPTLHVANEITYWGPDLEVSSGGVALRAQYLMREDNNPFLAPLGQDVETEGLVAELVVAPHGDRSRHYYTLLYNQVDSDIDTLDYESLTASATYLLARNLRLLAEYTRDIENERDRVTIGTVTAF
jgi:hypothetical protein